MYILPLIRKVTKKKERWNRCILLSLKVTTTTTTISAKWVIKVWKMVWCRLGHRVTLIVPLCHPWWPWNVRKSRNYVVRPFRQRIVSRRTRRKTRWSIPCEPWTWFKDDRIILHRSEKSQRNHPIPHRVVACCRLDCGWLGCNGMVVFVTVYRCLCVSSPCEYDSHTQEGRSEAHRSRICCLLVCV